jgi:hypothetical protein
VRYSSLGIAGSSVIGWGGDVNVGMWWGGGYWGDFEGYTSDRSSWVS